MLYVVVKGVPNDTYGCLTIGNILGIFANKHNAEFYVDYLNKQMATSIDILEVFDDNTIKGLIMTENLKEVRNNE